MSAHVISCPNIAKGNSSCTTCAELAVIEEEIAAVETLLASLKRKRAPVYARRNQANDLLTSRLPVELVVEVFKKFVPAGFDKTYAIRMNGTKYDETVTTTPLLLGAVCTAWRTIAWSTPALWASITVNIDIVPKSLAEIVGQWLGRSGTLPLYIMIYTEVHYKQQNCAPAHSEEIIDILDMFRHRWFHLYLEELVVDFFPELCSLVADAPMLNKLDLDTFYREGCIDLKMIPNLRRIRDRMPNRDSLFGQLLDINWTTLTHLECTTFSTVDMFLELFSKASFLTHLVFCGFRLSPSERRSIQREEVSSVFVHERLVYLKLQERDEETQFVLQRIQFPALQHVLGEKLDSQFFERFIRHNCCILKTIELYPNLYGVDLLSFLEENPSLETLILHCYSIGNQTLNSFFMRLAETAGNQPFPSEPVFLRYLRLLRIYAYRLDFNNLPYLLSKHSSRKRRSIEDSSYHPQIRYMDCLDLHVTECSHDITHDIARKLVKAMEISRIEVTTSFASVISDAIHKENDHPQAMLMNLQEH